MPIVTTMPNGVKGGIGGGNGSPEKRGKCNGWSAGSARRNMNWLMSVDTDLLKGPAFAYTLTVGDIPASHDEWAKLVKNVLRFFMRNGAIRHHWVVEWQKRGAPHMHGVVYLDPENINYDFPWEAKKHWLKMTAHLGTSSRCQEFKELRFADAWNRYVSKHAGRGYAHYQRAKGSLPPEWQQTGRMWGKGGPWPTVENRYDLSNRAFQIFRRMMRSWLIAQSRTDIKNAKNWLKTKHGPDNLKAAVNALKYRKRMLKRNDIHKSRVRGISEWAPQAVQDTMLAHLHEIMPWDVQWA